VVIGRTIHGSRTLLRNCKIVQRQIVDAFRGGDAIQFGEYAVLAEAAAIRAADRYDQHHPRGAKFSTYLHPRLRGVFLDWRESQVPLVYLDEPVYGDEGDEATGRESLIDRLPDLVTSYFPGGQKSYLPVPSDHWFAEGLVDHEVERRRLDVTAAKANLTERQKIILRHLRRRDDGYPYLAQQLGITYEYLKVEISRLKKKLKAAVT